MQFHGIFDPNGIVLDGPEPMITSLQVFWSSSSFAETDNNGKAMKKRENSSIRAPPPRYHRRRKVGGSSQLALDHASTSPCQGHSHQEPSEPHTAFWTQEEVPFAVAASFRSM